ncbi:hypothetical protein [Methylobacterium sp. SD21]|uniref:hypothetical protein n=1 Tax=Methylobacterium litchii TaxID=3138810 RepID=UPI00313BAB1E
MLDLLVRQAPLAIPALLAAWALGVLMERLEPRARRVRRARQGRKVSLEQQARQARRVTPGRLARRGWRVVLEQ